MADVMSSEKRRGVMSRIRGRDTGPELTLRARLRGLGLSLSIYPRGVPGTPDIAIKKDRIAVFVDGCFWHGCPRHYQAPVTRGEFWQQKLAQTRKRREEVRRSLHEAGWSMLELWECEIEADPAECASRIAHTVASRR